MDRMDSRNLQVGTEFWLQGGRYTNRVEIKMVRNGIVFFTRFVSGKIEWDRLTVEAFLESAITGEEETQWRTQQNEVYGNSEAHLARTIDYRSNMRKNRE